ncbi:MAG: cation-efflux pump [Candidatus Wukongarchaeota archaeon]|nr:cation-efflux pump [Candidatus Wukongarchaeota archaeon]
MEDEKSTRIKAALVSLIGVAILIVTEGIAMIITGSLAVFSGWAHSLINLVAIIIAYFGISAALKPADEDHMFGHFKHESFATLIEIGLLIAICFLIVYRGAKAIIYGSDQVEEVSLGIGFMLFSIFVDVSVAIYVSKIASKLESSALQVSAIHVLTDALDHAVIIVALILNGLFGVLIADPLAALIITVFVLYSGVTLSKRTIAELLDAAPPGLAEKISKELEKIPEIYDCHDVRVRKAGRKTFINLHVSISRTTPFIRVSEIINQAYKRVQEIVSNADVLIHSDTVELSDESIRDKIIILGESFFEVKGVHDVFIWETEGGRKAHIELHIDFDDTIKLKEAHDIVSKIEEKIREELSKTYPEVTITTHPEPVEKPVIVKPKDLRYVENKIEEVVKAVPEVRAICNIKAAEINSKMHIDLCIVLDKDMTLKKAHEIATEIEQKIKTNIPNVEKVLVHPEY